jgi:transposase-like protein
MTAILIGNHFYDAEKAREYLEKMRWAKGMVCPHCGSLEAYKLAPKPDSNKPVRNGVYKCKVCREQFTVTVGTIFEDSHIPLHKWLMAIQLLCSSKKGMSAHQLHRMLGITYKSAWFMAHRIRYAMSQPPVVGKLQGIIEADETYIGGKHHGKRGRGSENKTPVFALVERGGRVKKVATVTRIETLGQKPLLIKRPVETLSTHRQHKKSYASWSSIDGKLDVISVHRNPSFVIYEHGTEQRILCTFPDEWMDRVKDYLGLRVIAEGYIHYSESGLPISLSQPTSLERVPEPKQRDVGVYRGMLPGISGGLSSYEYIRRLREGNAK